MKRFLPAGTVYDFMILWNLCFSDCCMCFTDHLDCGLWGGLGAITGTLNSEWLNNWMNGHINPGNFRLIGPLPHKENINDILYFCHFVFQNIFRDFLKMNLRVIPGPTKLPTTLSSSSCILSHSPAWCFKTCQASNLNMYVGDFVLIVLTVWNALLKIP